MIEFINEYEKNNNNPSIDHGIHEQNHWMTNEIECVRKHLQCVLTLKAMDAWDSIQDTNTEA